MSLAENFCNTFLAAAVLSDFSLLCLYLGSRVFVQFFLLCIELFDAKRLSLRNCILFYCVLSRVVTTLSRSGFTQTKALRIKLSFFVR